MKFDSKIVPFDRGPAYAHQRAMLSRRENHLVDAVGLLRRAVEEAPDNREYRLDLAELYCEMGCYEQSNRLLLDMLAEKDAPAECFYGLALNRLSMNDEKGARRALRQYLNAEPEGERSEEVRQLTSEIDFFAELRLPRDRRLMRAQRAADRASDCMAAEDYEGADRMFARSLSLAPEQTDMLALSAFNLMLAGRTESGLERCRRALERQPVSVRARCLAALTFHMAGLEDESEAQMAAALRMDAPGGELRMLIHTAWTLGKYADVADLARRGLFNAPHDRELLHARAAALYKDGEKKQQAIALWTHILRIDPEDTVAAYYAEAAKADTLDPDVLGYAYQVPAEEYQRRLNYVAQKLVQGAEELTRDWRTDAEFRLLLKWCTRVHNESFQRAAVTVLAVMEDRDAVSTLREYLTRDNVPAQMKQHASAVLNLRGADLHQFMPMSDDVEEALLPDADALLNEYSVAIRQMIRFAADVLEDEYGLSVLPGLTMLWTQYACACSLKAATRMPPEAGAAALAACYLRMNGAEVDLRRLGWLFGCGQRQLMHIYRRMAERLSMQKGGKDAGD